MARGVLKTPFRRPTISCPPARIAPVEPAEIKASASPSLTSFSPLTILESGFALKAFTGDSSVEMTSLASTIVTLSLRLLSQEAMAFSILSSGPTNLICISLSILRASKAPSIFMSGQLSPPITSKAIFVMKIQASDIFKKAFDMLQPKAF